MRVSVISVMPSPYQRDVFAVLSADHSMDLQVFYQQESASDSPWERRPMQPWECVLPGWGFELNSRIRFQFNSMPMRLKASDIIIVNCSITSPFAQWLMRKALKGKRWIFWGERIRPASRPILQRTKKAMLTCMADASAIAAVGEQAVRDYQARFPGLRVRNIPYGCDIEAFKHKPPAHREEPVILFCGQMIYRKGVDLLLRAFAELVQKGAAGRLLLIGREGELAQWLGALPAAVRERVDWRGFVEPEKLPEFYGSSDIFVLPSRYDGWGVVVNQALAAALPIVCSDAAGCAGELVVDGRNGYVVPSGDLSALVSALGALLNDANLRKQFAEESERMAAYGSAETVAGRWKNLLNEVAS